ncbi:hypothetical protein [Burkholderia sp. Nafp2/4-1b]|uniref:hypothetical protein n=1 Tax=Burkholderia sp. Nafp2/4-1b TaxID=2116686 RepID=UPI0013CE795D|nr:hypothetical protein [Burkholderia sp. Nafp2/4-1b]
MKKFLFCMLSLLVCGILLSPVARAQNVISAQPLYGCVDLGSVVTWQTTPCAENGLQSSGQLKGQNWIAEIDANGNVKKGKSWIANVSVSSDGSVYTITFNGTFSRDVGCITTSDLPPYLAYDEETETPQGVTVTTTDNTGQPRSVPFKIVCSEI